MNQASHISIGRLIGLLKEEFPDLTSSKVRFLESRGMIQPSRSSSGYRQFGPSDIERLRFILQRQRDDFLPLKVIKSQLDRWEREEAIDGVTPQPDEPTSSESGIEDEPVYDLEKVADQAKLSRKQVRQLIECKLIVPHDRKGSARFTRRDIDVARQCRILIDRGLEPRHLRLVHNAVARHVELIGGLTAGLRRNRSPDAQRQAREFIAGGVEAMRQLHDLLFLAEARKLLQED